jgi:nitroreductase
MIILDALHWRYAAKRMNGQKVPRQQLDRILDAVRLAPSSYGLQPYSVLVIEDQALRERIRPIADGQP